MLHPGPAIFGGRNSKILFYLRRMHSFEQLSSQFADYFNHPHFPSSPSSLYEPNEYFLKIGGKRVRPILCLMGNELFDDLKPDAWEVAAAIELLHNFTLIHDD